MDTGSLWVAAYVVGPWIVALHRILRSSRLICIYFPPAPSTLYILAYKRITWTACYTMYWEHTNSMQNGLFTSPFGFSFSISVSMCVFLSFSYHNLSVITINRSINSVFNCFATSQFLSVSFAAWSHSPFRLHNDVLEQQENMLCYVRCSQWPSTPEIYIQHNASMNFQNYCKQCLFDIDRNGF